MKSPVIIVGSASLLLVLASLQPNCANAETKEAPAAKAVGGTTRFVAKPGTPKVRIEGTSTIHDWQMEGPIIGGYLEAGPGFPTEPGQEVKLGKVDAKVDAFIPVRSLKSLEKDGKPYSDKMNEIVFEKLKSDTQKQIVYHLDELVLKEAPKSKDAAYVFDSTGQLAVAGVTNKISMPVNITPLGDHKLKIIGTTKLKMTDFGIQPPAPTGLGLLIKTGDEVKLMIDWTVEQKAPAAAAAAK